MYSRTIGALVGALAVLPLAAQGQAPRDEGTVTVTATRAPQPLESVTADLSVIDAAQIAAAGQSTLIDLLRQLPGVEVVTQGGPGQPATIFLRGANSNHTVVLIDGVRQTSLNLGLGSLQSLPLAAIERIEVMRAPASGLYGADAIGGVIQIITRASRPGVTATIGAGGDGRRRADASWGFDAGDWRGGLSAAMDRSSGFDAVLPSNFAHHPDRDPHRQRSVQGRLLRRLGDDAEVALHLLSARNDTDIDAEFPPFSSAPNARSREEIDTLAVEAGFMPAIGWHSRLHLGESRDRFAWIDTLSFDDVLDNKTQTASWLNDVTFDEGRQGGRLGVETMRQTLAARATDYAAHRRTTNALLAGYHVSRDAHAMRIDLRHDRATGQPGVTSGNLGYAYRLGSGWALDARWGKAFKLPTFNDLYYVDPWGFFVANPGLAPETAYTGEVGLVRRTAVAHVDLRAFSSRISDLIANYDPDGFLGPLPGTVINTGRARIDGLSIDVAIPLGAWQWRAAATWQNARDATSGERLPRRARAHGNLAIERSVDAWALGAELFAQGARFDSLPNSAAGRLGGYALVNAYARRTLAPGWSAQVRLNNLFDRHYALADGYPVPGSNGFVELRYAMP